MNFWQALIDELCGPWGWLLIVSTISCLGFVGMTFSHFLKCLLTKNTTSLSKQFVIILPITNTLLTIYDLILFSLLLMNQAYGPSWAFLLPACINGLISAYGTMILKIKHSHRAKSLGITEIEYYEKYLKPQAISTKKNKKNKN